MYEREKGWRSVNVKVKKTIKNNYKKMERKKIMTWTLTWLNVNAAILNVTFQFLIIYRYRCARSKLWQSIPTNLTPCIYQSK